MPIRSRHFSSVLVAFLFFMICPVVWGQVQTHTLQDTFWSAMSKKKYSEAGKAVDSLLVRDPSSQMYRFQKAEWLWQSKSPAKAMAWLAKQEQVLDKNEVVNFFNKMLPKFSQRDWIRFCISLIVSRRPALNVIDATVLTRELSAMADARQPLLIFKDRLLRNFNYYPIELQFELAVLIDRYGFSEEAEKLYEIVRTNKTSYRNAGVWIAKVYMRQKQYKEARTIVDQGLKKDPKSYQLLLLRGELMESTAQRDFLSAVKTYNYTLRLYPTNKEAFNVKMRALMDVGANSVVLERLSENPQSDPVLLQRARGNMAMNYIRWDEPRQASAAMTLKERSKDNDYERARNFKVALDPQAVNVENNRARWDAMLVMFQEEKFQDVIEQYKEAMIEDLEVPPWVLKAVADSYLYKRDPGNAFLIYIKILDQDPNSFETKIALYYTFIDLGRYNDADLLLETMDLFEPVRVVERGILRDNSRKAEIASNKIWLLMYQDRLKKAHKIGRQFFTLAPGDIQLRSAMAHLYLWRGWPRRALEEFRVIRTMSPSFVAGSVGYARALYNNMQKEEAREFMEALYKKYPRNRHVARAKRLMEVDDMGLLTLRGSYTRELPGEDEFSLSARVDQPLNDHHQFFAELIRRETTREEGNDLTERFYIGDIWRPNNTWKLTGALTGNYTTTESLGAMAGVELTPDDYWTHAFHYDSRTIDVPLRSRAAGIDVADYKLSTRYRRHESFNTGLSIDLRDFEDGNNNWTYIWTTDSAVKTYAYWKWRLGTELSYSTYSEQDVDYYSPEGVYDFYLIPNVEHVWWRKYEKGLIDRLFLGLGRQWEKSFGAANVGYVNYEVEYQHSDTAGVTVGSQYSLRSHDGQDMNVLDIYTTLKKRF